MIYCDTSALTKLVLLENETHALAAFLGVGRVPVSSDLVRTELRRAVLRRDASADQRVESVIERIDLVALREEILDDAGAMSTPALRSLDAIHIASARALGPDLQALVSYDVRMLEAAAALGLPVSSPA